MSLSAIERFKVRSRVSQEVEVRFLPPSLYQRYIEQKFGQDSELQPKDLSDEQKIEAENELCELTFKFTRMAETDFRGFVVSFSTLKPEDMAEIVEKKLAGHFVSAKHEPKDGSEAIEFTKQSFKEFLVYLNYIEMFGLVGGYIKAMKADEALALKNENTPAMNGGVRLENALQ